MTADSSPAAAGAASGLRLAGFSAGVGVACTGVVSVWANPGATGSSNAPNPNTDVRPTHVNRLDTLAVLIMISLLLSRWNSPIPLAHAGTPGRVLFCDESSPQIGAETKSIAAKSAVA